MDYYNACDLFSNDSENILLYVHVNIKRKCDKNNGYNY